MGGPLYASRRLDHLGLVAGVCRRIGLVELINEVVGRGEREVSPGEVVLAMILNALGFVGRPLYLMPEFLQNKPLDLLIRPGLDASQFNDDLLGRTLDLLYSKGVTEVFAHVSSHACAVFRIVTTFAHLDTTTFSFHGRYAISRATDPPDEEEPDEPAPIRITQGHSKDHRPDLNQAVLSMICSHQTALPLWVKALSGNTSDKTHLPEAVEAFCDQLGSAPPPYFVADSALYTRENVARLSRVKWVTRVPATLKAVQTLYADSYNDWQQGPTEGYQYRTLTSTYGDVKQRWILVFSEPLYDRHHQTLQSRIAKERERADQEARRLHSRSFECEADACAAASALSKAWKYHHYEPQVQARSHYARRGRPKAGQEPDRISYRVQGQIHPDTHAIAARESKMGQFVIATNELEEGLLSPNQLIEVYKSQTVSVERGFRFLKDPLFFAHALYLKKPERIMALLMIMTLALLVYALADKTLQDAIEEKKPVLHDPHRGEVRQITMRRVFQLFEGIELLTVSLPGSDVHRVLVNFQPIHDAILQLMGPDVQRFYPPEWRSG